MERDRNQQEAKKRQDGRITKARRPFFDPSARKEPAPDDARPPVYIDGRRRKWPPWSVALIVFIALMAGLFIVVPRLGGRVSETFPSGTATPSSPAPSASASGADAVIAVSSAPVLSSPDLKAERLGDALFNEPCVILGTEGSLWLKVRFNDGVEGYVRRDQLAAGSQSVNPNAAVVRVLVVDKTKPIMSHAYQGTWIAEAPMGSVLFSDYRSGDLLRVIMPDGGEGWISATGVLTGPASEPIMTDDDPQTVFVSTVQRFFRSPYIPAGATARGMSPEGAVFVASRLVGLDVPRTMAGLRDAGDPVALPEKDGMPDFTSLHRGDLVFYRVEGSETLKLAVCVEDSSLLTSLQGKTTLRLVDFISPEARQIAARTEAVRRLFP